MAVALGVQGLYILISDFNGDFNGGFNRKGLKPPLKSLLGDIPACNIRLNFTVLITQKGLLPIYE